VVKVGRGSSRPEYRLVRNSCERGSGPSGSAIDGKFLDLLFGYQLLRNTLLQGVS
jgi:hypothetical protein